jgi:hypothetical protein
MSGEHTWQDCTDARKVRVLERFIEIYESLDTEGKDAFMRDIERVLDTEEWHGEYTTTYEVDPRQIAGHIAN